MKKVKLGEVATFINGYAFKPQDWSTEGKEIIRIQNLTKTSKEINYYSGKIDKKYIVETGDILISWSGTIGVFQWYGKTAVLNQHIFKVVFDKLDLDRSYFKYVVEKGLQDALKNTHGSTMKHLTKKYFDNIVVSYTSFKEQQRISSKLDLLSNLILMRQEQLEELNLLVKSRFNEMFGDPVLNEMGWEKHALKEFGIWKSGGTPKRNDEKYFRGHIPWITSGELEHKYIDDSFEKITEKAIECSSAKIIEKGSLLLGMYDTAGLKSSINTKVMSCNQAIAFAKLDDKITNTIYVYYVIQNLRSMLLNQQRGVRQKNFNLSMIKNISIPLPPLALQNEFADFVAQVDKSQLAIQKFLEELETLKKSLMQEYFG